MLEKVVEVRSLSVENTLERSPKFRIRHSLPKFERWRLEDSRRPRERLGETQVRNSLSTIGGNSNRSNGMVLEWI
jgi:hypothetical protein